jgi:hypothetical protein
MRDTFRDRHPDELLTLADRHLRSTRRPPNLAR